MHDTNTEIELKLALVKGSLARARRAIGDVHFDETAIEDIYFDTPDATLRRRGLVLRLRRDGDRWLQTLKAAHSGHGVVPVRGEWEVALPARTSAPALDLERFEITPLRVLLRSGLQADSLVPVFRTRISRQRGTLMHGTSEIEVALDQGELRARVDGRKRRQPVAEVELELKSGRPHDLLAVGSELVAQCRRTTLVPALRSKAERGYGLAARDGMGAVRASAGGFAERIRPDMPAAEALREVIRHGLALVVANADALRADPASEHVHQSRVALRRMRSAIRWFDPRGADFPPRLGRQLRWLAAILGAARDWDVMVEQTLPAILSVAALDDADARALLRSASQAQARSIKRAVAAVSSRRYARLVLRIASWSMEEGAAATDSVSETAAALFEQAAGRLFRDARSFSRLSPHKRHRVRIHAKRLRYALDLLGPSLPRREAADYIEALAALQDTLGELNDASVALTRLTAAVEDEGAARTVEEWFSAVEPALVSRAAQQLSALRRRPRPWPLG
ncbi:MAG TPA: CHAD domain-containing protein [Burkholderiaceae bacterium]|nr:CHAD domain-containing protein [Burkholderiaceae bacterium]